MRLQEKITTTRGLAFTLAAATAERVREIASRYDECTSGAWHLNTPRLVADATGTTVWRWDQAEPFGANPADQDPDANSVSFDLPLRLPGQRYDAETALHYNYFRDYDPSLGRYGESDPIGLRGGLNTYLYGRANSLRYVDPRGESAGAAVVIGGSALVVGAAMYLSSPTGKKAMKDIVRKIEEACTPANDDGDDDVDCEEWLRLLNEEYDLITKLDQAGGDMRLMKKQHNRSVVLFCKACAYLCHKAKSF